MGKETIRDTSTGRILGYIEYQANGDSKVTDAYGNILGGYRKNQNVTVDVGGRILFNGDMSASLIGMFGKK